MEIDFYSEQKGGTFINIDPRAIAFDKSKNPRQDYGNIEEFADFIESNGAAYPPICVKKTDDGRYELTHGFRRMAATLMAIERGVKILRVPAIIKPIWFSEEQAMQEHLTLNSGKPLTPLEQGSAMAFLQKKGHTIDEIAAACGKSVPYVKELITLSNAPKSVKDTIISGKVSSTAAVKMMKGKTEEEGLKTISKAVDSAEKAGRKRAFAPTNRSLADFTIEQVIEHFGIHALLEKIGRESISEFCSQ